MDARLREAVEFNGIFAMVVIHELKKDLDVPDDVLAPAALVHFRHAMHTVKAPERVLQLIDETIATVMVSELAFVARKLGVMLGASLAKSNGVLPREFADDQFRIR